MENVSCPVHDVECPYYKAGICTMPEEDGSHPLKECDDYGFALEGEGDEYTYDDLGNNWW